MGKIIFSLQGNAVDHIFYHVLEFGVNNCYFTLSRDMRAYKETKFMVSKYESFSSPI